MKPRCNLFLQSAAIAVSLVFCMASANAAILTWDSNTSTSGAQDGGGTWTSGAGGWLNGTTNVNWNTNDQAIFGAGTDGTYTINLGGAITVGNGNNTTGGLNFVNSGYTLSAATRTVITLGTGTSTGVIRVASGKTAVIGNNVTVSKGSAAQLALLGGGTLEIASGGILTNTNGNTNEIANGSTLRINGGSATFQTSLVVGQFTSGWGNSGTLIVDAGSLTINTNNLNVGRANGDVSVATLNSGAITVTAGNLNFGATATSTSTFNLNGGTLSVRQITDTNTTSLFNFNGGTLKASTSANSTFMTGLDRANIRNGGGTIDNNGQNLTIGQALLHSDISGDNAVDGGLTLNDSAVTKGTLTLTGANTYTGNTTIQAGTLKLGTGGSIANSALVDVRSGATFDVTTAGFALGAGKTLKGGGNVLGSVTVAGTGIVTGGDGASGTLAIGGLTFSGSGIINVGTLGNYLAAPAVNVTGALALSGGSGAVTINLPTATAASGTYRLLGFGSGIADASGFTLGTGPALGPRQSGSGLQYDGTNKLITYTISAVNPIWTGAHSSEWSTNAIAGPKNWKLPDNSTTDFLVGDEVFFDDSAAGKTVNVSNGNVTPASVTFNNSTGNDYTLQGANGITGTAVLTKNGAGSLTITNANSYTGATSVNNGSLVLDGSIGSTAITVAGGATFTQGATGSIGGTASLTTSGTSTLAGANTYSGATNINGGSLAISGTGTLSSNSAITLGGGSLNLAGTSQTAGAISITAPASSGDTIGNGSLTGTSYAASNSAGNAVISANLLANGAAGFTKSGAGTVTLSGTNTYNGATAISAGTIKAGSSSTFTNDGALSMTGTGTFDLAGFDAAFTNLSATSGNTITTSGAGNGTDTLTISVLSAGNGALFSDNGTRMLALNLAGSTVDPLTNNQNTFSGGLTLGNAIRINVAADSVGTAGNITSSRWGKGTITVNTAGQIFFNAANATLLNDVIVNDATGNGSRSGSIRVDTAGNTLAGQITANAAAATFKSGGGNGAITLTGKVTGGNGLTVAVDNGTSMKLTLNNAGAANDYQGATIVGTSSTLSLGASNQIPNGGGKGNVSLTGTLDLNGFSETINGVSGAGTIDNVSSGTTNTLTLGDGDASGTDFSGVIKNTTGTLSLVKTGIGIQILSGANTYGGTTLISAGTLQIGNGGGTGSLSSGSTITNNGTLAFNHSGTLTQGTNFAAGITGSGALTKAGSGTVILSGTNSYLGTTTVNGGELRLASAGAISGSDIAVNAGRLSLDGGTITGLGKTVTIKGDGSNFFGALQGNSGTNEWQGSVTIAASGTRIGVNAGQFTVSGTIDSGASAHGVTFRPNAGTTLILSGSNTYLGDTSIITNSGNVRLSGGNNRLPTGTRLLFGTGTTSGILDLNGQNQQVAGISVVGGSNNEIKSGTAATLTINTVAASPSTWAGKITGATALTKTGPDNLTLTNENTYTGNTTISQGALILGIGGSIANSSTIHIGSGATLDVSAGSGNTIAAIQTLTGSGTVEGDLTVNGTLNIGNSPGTMIFNDNLSLSSSSVSNFEFTLASLTAGSFDLAQSLLGGGVTFGGTLNLIFDSGETYADNSSATIFDFSTYAGSFSSVTYSGLGAGQNAVFDASTGIVTIIPEPGALALAALGSLAFLRRRRSTPC